MFSFYDRTGIEDYLEKQAKDGWLLEKNTAFGWIFRRIEPADISFSVTYFPKASAFDPEPSEQQKDFREFCEHTGWTLAASNAQMQIFYNRQEDPVPIETDAGLEVDQIHASAKKNFLPVQILLFFTGLLQAALAVYRLSVDPVDVLTSSVYIFSCVCWLIMLVLSGSEIAGYFRWYWKARKTAETTGCFTATRGHSNFQLLSLLLLLLALAFMILASGGKGTGFLAILSVLLVLGITAIVIGCTQLMKRLKLPAKINRIATVALTLLLSFGFTALLVAGLMSSIDQLLLERTPADSYVLNGDLYYIFDDDLPLKIEDLTETEYDGYSYEIYSQNSSFLAEEIKAAQYPRRDALEYPELEYTLLTVKAPFLYNFCKNALLDDFAHNYGHPVPEPSEWQRAETVDSAPWGAREAYQLVLSGEPHMRFLLCYDGRIVEITFEHDWELTAEQMAAVGEKLAAL